MAKENIMSKGWIWGMIVSVVSGAVTLGVWEQQSKDTRNQVAAHQGQLESLEKHANGDDINRATDHEILMNIKNDVDEVKQDLKDLRDFVITRRK
jgi:hypothetical protein